MPLTPQQELMLKTYESLRKEIEGNISQMGTFTTGVLISTGAYWSWILSKGLVMAGDDNGKTAVGTAAKGFLQILQEQNLPAYHLILVLPVVLTFLFGMKVLMLHRATCAISEHLARIEKRFGADQAVGWETWCKAERERKLEPEYRTGGNGLKNWSHGYWLVMVFLNGVAWLALDVTARDWLWNHCASAWSCPNM